MITLFNSVIKILLTAMLKYPITDCTHCHGIEKRCRGKKPQLISGRSVTDNVNQSVSESNSGLQHLLVVDTKVKQKQNYSAFKVKTINNNFCPSYTGYLARSATLSRTV